MTSSSLVEPRGQPMKSTPLCNKIIQFRSVSDDWKWLHFPVSVVSDSDRFGLIKIPFSFMKSNQIQMICYLGVWCFNRINSGWFNGIASQIKCMILYIDSNRYISLDAKPQISINDLNWSNRRRVYWRDLMGSDDVIPEREKGVGRHGNAAQLPDPTALFFGAQRNGHLLEQRLPRRSIFDPI